MGKPRIFQTKTSKLNSVKFFTISKAAELGIEYFGEIDEPEENIQYLDDNLKKNKINILNLTGVITGLYVIPSKLLIVVRGEFGDIALTIEDILYKEYVKIFKLISVQNRLLKIIHKNDLNNYLPEFVVGLMLLDTRFSFIKGWSLDVDRIFSDAAGVLAGGIMYLCKSSFVDSKTASILLIKENFERGHFN